MMGLKNSHSGWTFNHVRPFDLSVTSVLNLHNTTDNFEILCNVVADISAAPCTLERGVDGRTCYRREYDVVLLVGLTELKAQIRWTDSITVCTHEQFRLKPLF